MALIFKFTFHLRNTTYSKMWAKIDTEWKFSKTCYKVKRIFFSKNFNFSFPIIFTNLPSRGRLMDNIII